MNFVYLLFKILYFTFLNASCLLFALNGDPLELRVNPLAGWKAFEVISDEDNPSGGYAMPSVFDGIGAEKLSVSELRFQINHERSDASISQVDINLANFKSAISNMISGGSTLGVTFVNSASQAYDRWSDDLGETWTNTSDVSTTAFQRFCSGQSYGAHTFGTNRGFVDELYITGEEVSSGRLFVLDLANRDFYQLSGKTGAASGGIAGMPFDAWENAALVDTGETNHVALLLSPDGGTQNMALYIGEKGKDENGLASSSLLARNGLAYGSYYYLEDTLPASGISNDGSFGTTTTGALNSSKLEDVDTSVSNPTKVVLGDQNSGLFIFDFALDFQGGSFSAINSSFTLTKIQNHVNDVDGSFGDADNVDWTAATTLGGSSFPEGLIFVNEDTGTENGEIWVMAPDGSGLTKIADTSGFATATETTGILDISSLVGYQPGSIILTNNQGSDASMTVLINPSATLVPEPSSHLLFALMSGIGFLRRRG